MTLAAGIHPDVPADAYHADPAPAPSLSAGLAATLVQRTPLHAWTESGRLNPAHQSEPASGEQDEGTALHALLLEQHDLVVPVEAADWRTKAAQESRAAIRAEGKVPILAARWDALRACADAFRANIARHQIGDFTQRPGRAEVTMLWQDEAEDGAIWCRSRTDWLCDDGSDAMIDLKTLGGTADPDAWARQNKDAALRAAHYLRGARALGIRRPRYLFCLLERNPPYALAVCELSPALLTIGEEQHQVARNLWAACLKDGEWPAFPPFLATVEASSGALYAHEDWRQRQQQIRERKPKPFAGQASERIASTIRSGGEPFA